MIDTHAHLYFPDYRHNLPEVMDRAVKAGVRQFICVGIDEKTSRQSVKMAEKDPRIWATVGVHPHDAARVSPRYLSELEKLAASPRVCAIGETGLDYYRDRSPREQQEYVFRAQINLARHLKKPVVIHCRDAYGKLLEIITAEKISETGGVVHCYSGDRQFARQALNMGLYISIAGPVTYPRSQSLRSVVKMIPLDRILLETDAPFLTPQPWRGQKNEPSYIKATYEAVAEIKEVPLTRLIEACRENARTLFATGDVID